MIAQAPNLLLTMINMMLKYGSSPNADDEDYALYAVDNDFNSSIQVGYMFDVLLVFYFWSCRLEYSLS